MDMIPWNESVIDKLELRQNVVARIVLNTQKYTAVETMGEDMGWSPFRERQTSTTADLRPPYS